MLRHYLTLAVSQASTRNISPLRVFCTRDPFVEISWLPRTEAQNSEAEFHTTYGFEVVVTCPRGGRLAGYCLCRGSGRHGHWARERSVGLAAADPASLTADQLPCL